MEFEGYGILTLETSKGTLTVRKRSGVLTAELVPAKQWVSRVELVGDRLYGFVEGEQQPRKEYAFWYGVQHLEDKGWQWLVFPRGAEICIEKKGTIHLYDPETIAELLDTAAYDLRNRQS